MTENFRIEQEPLEITPEGKRAIQLFRDAKNSSTEEESTNRCLEFIRYLKALIDDVPIYDQQGKLIRIKNTELSADEIFQLKLKELEARLNSLNFGDEAKALLNGDGYVAFGSGTSYERAYVTKSGNKIVMNYNKPADEFDQIYYDRYKEIFKIEQVELY